MVPPPPIPAPLWNTIPPEAQAALLALVASLEQRIADLEAENADLRRRLAQVEHQLQTIRQRGRRPSTAATTPTAPAPTAGARNIVSTPAAFAFGPSGDRPPRKALAARWVEDWRIPRLRKRDAFVSQVSRGGNPQDSVALETPVRSFTKGPSSASPAPSAGVSPSSAWVFNRFTTYKASGD